MEHPAAAPICTLPEPILHDVRQSTSSHRPTRLEPICLISTKSLLQSRSPAACYITPCSEMTLKMPVEMLVLSRRHIVPSGCAADFGSSWEDGLDAHCQSSKTDQWLGGVGVCARQVGRVSLFGRLQELSALMPVEIAPMAEREAERERER